MVNNYDFTKYNFLLTIPGNFITGLLDIDEALAAVCRPLHQLNASTNCGTRYSPHVARWPGRASDRQVGVGGRSHFASQVRQRASGQLARLRLYTDGNDLHIV